VTIFVFLSAEKETLSRETTRPLIRLVFVREE
jgi:hypothetical protein